MKHLLLVVAIVCVFYGMWQLALAEQKAAVKGFLRKHGIRLAIFLLVMFVLFIQAVQTNPLSIF